MAALLKEPTGEEPVRVLRTGVIFLKNRPERICRDSSIWRDFS
jgi:hypothetical protein